MSSCMRNALMCMSALRAQLVENRYVAGKEQSNGWVSGGPVRGRGALQQACQRE